MITTWATSQIFIFIFILDNGTLGYMDLKISDFYFDKFCGFSTKLEFIFFSKFSYFQNMKPKNLLSFFGYLLEPCIEIWRFCF